MADRRRSIVGLLLGTVALIGASYLTGVEAVGGYLRAATLVTTLGALGLAMAEARRTERR